MLMQAYVNPCKSNLEYVFRFFGICFTHLIDENWIGDVLSLWLIQLLVCGLVWILDPKHNHQAPEQETTVIWAVTKPIEKSNGCLVWVSLNSQFTDYHHPFFQGSFTMPELSSSYSCLLETVALSSFTVATDSPHENHSHIIYKKRSCCIAKRWNNQRVGPSSHLPLPDA